MSNKDTSNETCQKKKSKNDIFKKDEMLLFSYELLKSKKMFTVSSTNSFRYEFSDENDDLNYLKNKEKSISKVNNRKISIIYDENNNNSSLKTLNIEVPSTDRLSKSDFKNKFLDEYDDSFANYCGINKEQYENIYIQNKYCPKLDKFGNIKINIKNIIKVLKNYSFDTKSIKKIKKRRFKKIFKIFKKNIDSNINKKKFPFKINSPIEINYKTSEINKDNKIQNNDNNIIKIIQIPLNKNINNNNIFSNTNLVKNHFSLNLKDKVKGLGLSMSIPKEAKDSSKINLKNINPLTNVKITNNIPFNATNPKPKNMITQNNFMTFQNRGPLNSVFSNSRQPPGQDIFNFSKLDINLFNPNNINNINKLLSPNNNLLTPLYSPFSPFHNVYSAHLFNNAFFQDGLSYNNLNSPAYINININNNINLNNNMFNGYALNNNINIGKGNMKINNSSNNSFSNIS